MGKPVVIGAAGGVAGAARRPGARRQRAGDGQAVRVDRGQATCSSGSARSASTRRRSATTSTWRRCAAAFPARIRRAATACRRTTRSRTARRGSSARSRSASPQLIIPVGKLAIARFLDDAPLVGDDRQAASRGAIDRRHSAAASVGRVDLVSRRAGQDADEEGARAHRQASGVEARSQEDQTKDRNLIFLRLWLNVFGSSTTKRSPWPTRADADKRPPCARAT